MKATSCQSYFDQGQLGESGNYFIDPDESGPNEPFLAFCDISGGFTMIKPELTSTCSKTAKCEITVFYGVKLENMVDLATISKSCKQNIEVTPSEHSDFNHATSTFIVISDYAT